MFLNTLQLYIVDWDDEVGMIASFDQVNSIMKFYLGLFIYVWRDCRFDSQYFISGSEDFAIYSASKTVVKLQIMNN